MWGCAVLVHVAVYHERMKRAAFSLDESGNDKSTHIKQLLLTPELSNFYMNI